jgi:hypothetical protein
LIDLLHIAFKMQEKSKQLSAAFLHLHGSLKWTVRMNFNSLVNMNSVFCFWKSCVMNWFHSYCSCECLISLVLFTWMWIIIFLKKKTSLGWIKFTHIVISILFMIIFYLILLHVQKIIETLVFVGWILYVMEL